MHRVAAKMPCAKRPPMKVMTCQELKQLRDANEAVDVIDVREPYEYEIMNIGGTLIPMAEIMDRAGELSRERKVVIHCRSGKRSAAVVDSLEREFNFTNLYSLEGGALAWATEIDPSLPQY